MMEDRGNGGRADSEPPDDDMSEMEQGSRGSGVIFALVAIALVLAIVFFYLTKDREGDPGRAVTEATESVDSAARVVGDAAHDAADRLRNNN